MTRRSFEQVVTKHMKHSLDRQYMDQRGINNESRNKHPKAMTALTAVLEGLLDIRLPHSFSFFGSTGFPLGPVPL
jgi:hypothetical protein